MQTPDNRTSDNKRLTKRRAIAGILVVICMAGIFTLSHIPGESYPNHPGFLNYVAHFCEYVVLAVLLSVAFTGGRLRAWQILLLALVLASLYAASDEFHQLFVSGRTSDVMDWVTDTAGACTGATLTMLFYALGRKKEKEAV
jgi:VanZ family protein